MKKQIQMIAIIGMLLLLSQNIFSAVTLRDVSKNDWFFPYISSIGKYVEGYSDGTLRPSNNVTVAEFIALVVRTNDLQSEETKGFVRIPYLQTALDNGLILPHEFLGFSKDITRGEIATILARTPNIKHKLEIPKDKMRFKDELPKESENSINLMNDNAISTGYSDNTFRAAQKATRAEALVMLKRTNDKSRTVSVSPISLNVYLDEDNVLLVKMLLQNGKEEMIQFNYGGVNGIYSLSKIENGSTNAFNIGTDFIGPYIMTSDSNSENTGRFTGGWHGSNGNGTGGETGRSKTVTINLDGYNINKNEWVSGDELIINVCNEIKGNNSTNYILDESVTYTVTNQMIDIDVLGTAKEDLTIHKYYGLQTQNAIWNTIEYKNSSKNNIYQYTDSKTSSEYTLRDFNGYYLRVTLNEGGLGNYQYKEEDLAKCFSLEYGKTYFNLVNGKDLDLNKGQNFNWTGSCFFGYE